jgi:hypothetical protein
MCLVSYSHDSTHSPRCIMEMSLYAHLAPRSGAVTRLTHTLLRLTRRIAVPEKLPHEHGDTVQLQHKVHVGNSYCLRV